METIKEFTDRNGRKLKVLRVDDNEAGTSTIVLQIDGLTHLVALDETEAEELARTLLVAIIGNQYDGDAERFERVWSDQP